MHGVTEHVEGVFPRQPARAVGRCVGNGRGDSLHVLVIQRLEPAHLYVRLRTHTENWSSNRTKCALLERLKYFFPFFFWYVRNLASKGLKDGAFPRKRVKVKLQE